MLSDPIRLNKFIAQSSKFSRRGADEIISQKRVMVNGNPAQTGQSISSSDVVTLDGQQITGLAGEKFTTVMLNKPVGYVCSRRGQGSRTIYDLLPSKHHNLNPVGRLDKNSSGLLLLTNDGELAQNLTHPSYQKIKVYQVSLDKSLQPLHQQMISDYGLQLEDGPSKLQLEKQSNSAQHLIVTMREGRNRQIRRTFEALGYEILALHRVKFGNYDLLDLPSGKTEPVN